MIATLARFTEIGLLIPRLSSEFRDSAIVELASRLETAGRVENANAFAHMVLDHESVSSAIFDDVALPLAHAYSVKKLSFALGLSPRGIHWGAGHAPTIHAIVLFAVPLSAGQNYLSLVVAFSEFLNNKAAFGAFRHCSQPGEMLAVLDQVRLRQTGPQLTAPGQ